MVTADGRMVQVSQFDPQQIIEQMHAIGLEQGYQRVRLDRGQTDGPRGPWYEAGYGCREVKLRTSHAGFWVTHHAWTRADVDEVRRLLISNQALAGWVPKSPYAPPGRVLTVHPTEGAHEFDQSVQNADELLRCTACEVVLPADNPYGGLCSEHKYDEQEPQS